MNTPSLWCRIHVVAEMKEKEIELLKEKMRALEERKKANLVMKSTPANVSVNEVSVSCFLFDLSENI